MSQTAVVASPWRNRPEPASIRAEKREAVLNAAVKLFNEKGFHATSLDDVARSLAVTKPTIYHYFANKDDVLFECVRLGLDGIKAAAADAAAQGGSGMARLRLLIRTYALIKTQDFGMLVSRTSDDQLRPESRAQFRAMKREIHDLLESVVADGVADGSIRTRDPRLAAFAIAGSLNWIARWYVPGGAMSAEEIADGMVDTLTLGLVPDGSR